MRQPVAVARQPHRNGGYAPDGRVKLAELLERICQLVAVVEAGAEHKLSVHRGARFCKLPDVIEGLSGTLVAHHPDAKLRIHGVHGDIHRADMHIYNAPDVLIPYVRQRDIIAEKEGEPCVVILEIQTLAQIGRKLIYKAEYAVIGAASLLVHKEGLKAQTVVLSRAAYPDTAAPAVRLFNDKLRFLVVNIEAVIEHVVYFMSVDRNEPVARPDKMTGRRRTRLNGRNQNCHKYPLSHKSQKGRERTCAVQSLPSPFH